MRAPRAGYLRGVTHLVHVRGVPDWADPPRLLGPTGAAAPWSSQDGTWSATLDTDAAADLAARLRGVGLGGALIEVRIEPPLPRDAVRAARTVDARRRRDTSEGFTRRGARLDAEGRVSLTPEALALALGREAVAALRPGGVAGGGKPPAPILVLDAGCGAGGNTIGFARAGCRVNAVERDAGRLADARHNAALYGVADRCRVAQGDAVEAVRRGRADLLFVDPPWGTEWDRARTGLDALAPLAEVLAARGDRYAATWLKLPPSFDAGELPGWSFTAWYGVAEGDARRVKFVLARGPRA